MNESMDESMDEPIAAGSACSPWCYHSSGNGHSCVIWLLIFVELYVLLTSKRAGICAQICYDTLCCPHLLSYTLHLQHIISKSEDLVHNLDTNAGLPLQPDCLSRCMCKHFWRHAMHMLLLTTWLTRSVRTRKIPNECSVFVWQAASTLWSWMTWRWPRIT